MNINSIQVVDGSLQFVEQEYKVIATIEHTGEEIQTGHYRSYVLKNYTWYRCDDETVQELPKNSEKPIKNAYILILKKII